jgi:phosphatidate cytidylyltransferase
MTTPPPKNSDPKSDLAVRTLSAVVMLAVAGTALWLGGWWFNAFAALVGLGVLWEWSGLSKRFAESSLSFFIWELGGIIYVGSAVYALTYINRDQIDGLTGLLVWIGMVIATDIGAYFAGRTFGGPKIAPKISPSKTWSGLSGGMLAASAVAMIATYASYQEKLPDASQGHGLEWLKALVVGCLVAAVAQTGDFFESWMKRRAGVKDSGRLIPGHGGLFDRVDGLLAVLFVMGIATLVTRGVG